MFPVELRFRSLVDALGSRLSRLLSLATSPGTTGAEGELATPSGEETMATDSKLRLIDIDPADRAAVRRWEEQMLKEAGVRIRAEMRAAKEAGIIDDEGNYILPELPPDMRPTSKTDV